MVFSLLQGKAATDKKPKSPAELVRSTSEALLQCEHAKSSGSELLPKSSEELSRNLSSMKILLYGEPDQRPNPETATTSWRVSCGRPSCSGRC